MRTLPRAILKPGRTMRLLQYNSDGNFNLTEFFNKAIPEYAILSHRWGTEEATFEDLQKGTGTKKAGYEKLRLCGEQARGDGLKHFWVDTCCIDKSSSSELAEALNSMYRWYRNAARCYVYLLDVSAPKQKAGDISTEYTWESAFRDSEWFTRLDSSRAALEPGVSGQPLILPADYCVDFLLGATSDSSVTLQGTPTIYLMNVLRVLLHIIVVVTNSAETITVVPLKPPATSSMRELEENVDEDRDEDSSLEPGPLLEVLGCLVEWAHSSRQIGYKRASCYTDVESYCVFLLIFF